MSIDPDETDTITIRGSPELSVETETILGELASNETVESAHGGTQTAALRRLLKPQQKEPPDHNKNTYWSG